MSALSWMCIVGFANIFLGSRMLYDVSLRILLTVIVCARKVSNIIFLGLMLTIVAFGTNGFKVFKLNFSLIM